MTAIRTPPPLDRLVLHGAHHARRVLLDPVLQRFASPTAQRLLHVGGSARCDPSDTLAALLGHDAVEADAVEGFGRRWSELQERLVGRRVRPEHYDLEARSAKLLYALVRALRPATVVETGVANGVSTFFVTSALLDNGSGTLFSVDVSPDVAPLLPPAHRERWELTVLPGSRRRRALARLLDDVGRVDLFVHDSHHSYRWQLAEYELASAHMVPGAVLASDDVDASFAFATFCEQHGLRAEFLFDARKFFGVTKWTGGAANRDAR